jgi:tetratricopeptide (TPR) repeat protein
MRKKRLYACIFPQYAVPSHGKSQDMKRSKRSFLVKMALLVMVTVGLSSCRRTDVHDALVRAEALMESDPHAARAVLDSLNLQSSIFNFQSRDAALYALLRTQADYKCRVRLTSDSLPLIATSYYGTRRKTQRAALAQYYLGCTYSDMSRDLDAIDAFLRATTLFPDTTNKYYAYSQRDLGKMSLQHERDIEALEAFRHYRFSDICRSDSVNVGWADWYMGKAYLYLEQSEQAEAYLLRVIVNPYLSKELHANARFQLAKLNAYLKENYAKAGEYINSYIAGYKQKENIGAAYHIKADILLHENKLDSAFYYNKKVLAYKQDARAYCETYKSLTELSVTLNQTDSLDVYFQQYMAFADSVNQIRRDKEISDIENNHVVELHDRELAVQRSRLYWTWGILFFFLVFIASIIILLNDRRRKTEKLKYEEALNAIKQRYIAQTVLTSPGGSLPASPPIAVQKERIAIYQKRYESSEWKRYFNKHLSEIKSGMFMPAAEATQFEQYLSDLFVDMLLDMFRDNEGLTDQEAQLCAMMLLGFKANQIAYVCRISADAVYMRRSRLKKRLASIWSDFVFPVSSPKP